LALASALALIALAQGLSDKTKPSKEYVRLNGRVVMERVCPSCPTVKVIDNTRTGTTHFRVGDSFTVNVKGSPNQPVVIVQNGGSPFNFGNTDASGNWSTTGSWQSGDAGSYTQYWTVAGVPAMPTTIFTVYAN
jgi:hypothetical protein